MVKTLKTEEKIKEAARSLFIEKGYSATKTREIAKRSGINLALLNYYFKSKAKLFELIMLETFHQFLEGMMVALNDPETSLDKKYELFVSSYIDLLLSQPNLPHFIIGELRNNPEHLLEKVDKKKFLLQSIFFEQLSEQVSKTNDPALHPMHFLMNMMSMTVFPFIARPMVKGISNMPDETFKQMMQERKTLIPKWMKMTLENNMS